MPTMWSNYQRLAVPPFKTFTVDTTHCNVVLIVCHQTSQFILCDTASDVQKPPVWGLGSVGGNVDEVEISTVSITEGPAHFDIHSSMATDIFREMKTVECWNRGRT